MKKRILIISKYIAPVQEIASIRWTKLAKYLVRSGRYEVSVLTDEKQFEGNGLDAFHKDAMLEKDMIYFTRYDTIPDNKTLKRYYSLKGKHSEYVKAGSETIGDISQPKRVFYELMHDWKDKLQFRSAVDFFKQHADLLQQDIVITSYGPLWTHLTGEWIKKHYPRIRWIADYRDLFCSDITPGIVRAYRHNFAKIHTDSADLVMTISKEMIPQLELPGDQKCLILPNGYDPDEALPPIHAECFSLLYTGKLYQEGTRIGDLRPIFTAIKQLTEHGDINPSDLILEYAGREGDLFRKQATDCGLESYVEDKGLVDRDEAVRLRQHAAGLLLCTWNTAGEQGVLTGKLFEYILAGKPIFAVCTGDIPDSQMSQILSEGNLGYCYETCRTDTFDILKEHLLSAYKAWKDNSEYYLPDSSYVEQFSHPYLAQQLQEQISNW